jgi:hypothetical protein
MGKMCQRVEIALVLCYYVPINSKLHHPPPGIPREFDFKSSPESREFDVLGLSCGWAFDNMARHRCQKCYSILR